MIINKNDLNISNENPKTYTIIEKDGEFHVCKVFGIYDNVEDALNLQTEIAIGVKTEEQASKDFFNYIHYKDIN